MRARVVGIALLCVVSTLVACQDSRDTYKGTDLSAVSWGGDFTLTAHHGKPVRASDFRGKVVVLFFGYTHCPDICAPTLSRLAQVMQRLGPDAARVQVLFISVDPRHDTPSQLAAFVPKFDERFVGLTGSDAEIAAVTSDYKVAYQSETKPGMSSPRVAHFGGLFVKDASGKLRLMLANEATPDDILHDVRRLLPPGV